MIAGLLTARTIGLTAAPAARRRAAIMSDHRQHDEFPSFCTCLSRWPCDEYMDGRDAEITRLTAALAASAERERVLRKEIVAAHATLSESDCVEDRCVKAMDMLDSALETAVGESDT